LKLTARRIVPSGLLALVFLAFYSSPASAATIVLDVSFTNVSIPLDTFPASICGVSGPFGGDILINELHLTAWDNGVFVFQLTNSVRLIDSGGNLILRDRASFHEVDGTGSLPISVGVPLVAICTPNSATPGKLVGFNFGFTIGTQGTLIEVHGVVCTSYPYC